MKTRNYFLLGVCFLFSIALNAQSAKLHKRDWNCYINDWVVHYQVRYEPNGTPILYLQPEVQNADVTVRAYESFKGKNLLFEQTQTMQTKTPDDVVNIPMTVSAPEWTLELTVRNKDTGKTFTDVKQIEPSHINSTAHIHVLKPDYSPYLYSTAKEGQELMLGSDNPEVKAFYIKIYDRQFQPAPPPYSRQPIGFFNANRDYSRRVTIKRGETFALPSEGLYVIQTDTLSSEGVYLMRFTSDYPDLTRMEDLALAARYVTKNAEYSDMMSAEGDIKVKVDNFWMKLAGDDKEKARDLLKNYYNRVRRANDFFTTYKEGWKTDKGMIYTVFGTPNNIHKTENLEEWTYPATKLRGQTVFIFDRYGDQYLLRRDKALELPWSAEIYEWRQ